VDIVGEVAHKLLLWEPLHGKRPRGRPCTFINQFKGKSCCSNGRQQNNGKIVLLQSDQGQSGKVIGEGSRGIFKCEGSRGIFKSVRVIGILLGRLLVSHLFPITSHAFPFISHLFPPVSHLYSFVG